MSDVSAIVMTVGENALTSAPTAVRNLVRAGIPERVAMQMTGHKTRAVFERYNNVSASDVKAAMDRLDTMRAAAKTQASD